MATGKGKGTAMVERNVSQKRFVHQKFHLCNYGPKIKPGIAPVFSFLKCTELQ